MQTKVAQWTEDNSDHEDFDLVNELMSRFEKTGRTSHLKGASLQIPRNRTLEKIQEAYEKAIKASKR